MVPWRKWKGTRYFEQIGSTERGEEVRRKERGEEERRGGHEGTGILRQGKNRV